MPLPADLSKDARAPSAYQACEGVDCLLELYGEGPGEEFSLEVHKEGGGSVSVCLTRDHLDALAGKIRGILSFFGG